MGNSSSSDHHADWKYETECGHSYTDIKVNEVCWIRVPLADDVSRVSTQILRGVFAVGTLGVSSALVKDLSHEALEFRTTCRKCGAKNWFTAEIRGKGDKDFRCGYFNREYNARHTYKPRNMTLQYAHDKYDEMGDSYQLVGNNCRAWTERLWDKL